MGVAFSRVRILAKKWSTPLLARALSGAVLGIDAYLVTVEADVASGLPAFFTVGLPQGAVKEGRERVIAAVQNSGYLIPPKRITVNLAPADISKSGSGFDLPIAMGIMAATGQLDSVERLGQYLLLGELALDGGLRHIRGALPMAIVARAAGLAGIVLPQENVAEAAVVEGLEVRGADTLIEVIRFMEGSADLPVAEVDRDALFRTASDVRRRLRGREGAGARQAGAGGGGGRISQPVDGRAPGLRQDDAGAAASRHPAAADVRRGAGDDQDPLRRRAADRAASRSSSAARSGTRTPPSPTRGSSAAAPTRGRARCRWRTTACCSWTSWRSSAATCWRCCGSRSRTRASPSAAPPCR